MTRDREQWRFMSANVFNDKVKHLGAYDGKFEL